LGVLQKYYSKDGWMEWMEWMDGWMMDGIANLK
jgi:hypothetical protein